MIRREFLKDSGILVAGVAATPLLPFGLKPSIASVQEPSEDQQLPTALTFEQRVAMERERHPIYTQFLDANGIIIKAPAQVDARALQKGREIVLQMTNFRSDIRTILLQQEAALAIVPRLSFITALPEYSNLSGRRTTNGRPYDSLQFIRGLGGVRGKPVTSTSEENLLRMLGILRPQDDVFWDESITHHEFGHTIMNIGFSQEELDSWKVIFENAQTAGLFRNYTYAMSNEKEYWAELTQAYFGVVSRSNGPSVNMVRTQDPNAYKFLGEVYGTR